MKEKKYSLIFSHKLDYQFQE